MKPKRNKLKAKEKEILWEPWEPIKKPQSDIFCRLVRKYYGRTTL